jgi:acetylornithine deacetylase/succinyl-diaminopimelate desuccinylase-like protein
MNLAYIYGGQNKGNSEDQLLVGQQGNIIADVCRFVLDIRPSRPELTAQKVINFITAESKKFNVSVAKVTIRHDLGSWSTPREQIKLGGLKLPFRPAGKTGYIDVQMLWQNFNQVPCFTIGAGNLMAHKPDEYVEVENIKKLAKIAKKLITDDI